MKLARVLLLASIASGLIAQTPTWDTSGNGMLNGTYYFRHVQYQLSSAGTGALYDAFALYGTAIFDGAGKYSMSVTLLEGRTGQLQRGTVNGTYSVAASGQGFLSNPLFPADSVYGLVNAQGVFVGSSTENLNGYNDVFIAAPLASPAPGLSTFKGSYSLAFIDLSSGTPLSTIGGMLQMNPDGAGNAGTVAFAGYVGQNGSNKATQSLSNVKYIFSNGAAVVTFPNSTTALFTGQYYLYFSPDGNFVFGGSPTSFDLFVGVRTGTGTPNLSGLYYEAGLDQDESTLSAGYASLDSFYGSLSANAGTIVGHRRLLDVFNASPTDYTYSDTFTVPANGAYSSAAMNYVVGSGIRIGSGIGPYLGISVALQAFDIRSGLSTTGVFLNPAGIVNAGSSAPFTASIVPGELLTLYGANLASGIQVASAIPFPTTLGKVQVTINNLAAPIYYVTPAQLSVIVPYGVTGSIAKVQVFNDNVPSNTVTTWIGKTAPGVLTQSQNGLGYGDVVHQDGTLVNAANPARIGETVSVFVTGLGAVSPTIADGAAGPTGPLANAASTITAYIGGVQATVGYAGLAPQLAGLYQINLTVPAGAATGDNYLGIAGPDAYSSVCRIAIAGAPGSTAAALPAYRGVPHALSRRGAIVPELR
ncbi:MAG: hypothetical protein NTW28_37640 [Candidatus Solibacter sp.]|nr:hypothetical protein [Candidatus Solibacter sp.]